MESYSLLELNRVVKQNLKKTMPESYWVVAEINEMHVNASGHCFLELIEKSSQNEQITAKARANIWAYHFRMLHPYFETQTGQRLSAGLKVMFQVSVEYHELFGMSFQVTDINPAFTIGDLAMQKLAAIQKLIDDGVINMNRELELPIVPQRIAVISSESAAGYGDFVDQLHHNSYGYVFHHTLFQATMQGNDAETSVISALEKIFEQENDFDVVVMIRGGGSQSDLNCFNSYRMACCMAQFPLPIITGIGHERDDTVADRVARVVKKTPTAVADFLIDEVRLFENVLLGLSERLADVVENSIQTPVGRLQQLSQQLQNFTDTLIYYQDKELQEYHLRLLHATSILLSQKKNDQSRLQTALYTIGDRMIRLQSAKLPQLQHQLKTASRATLAVKQQQTVWLEGKLQLLDPGRLLQRGYSITVANGKAVRSVAALQQGQQISTILYDGKIESVIVDI